MALRRGVCVCGIPEEGTLTVFTDGTALLRLVHGVHTLRDRTVGHHTVHLVVRFAAAPFTGRGLRAEQRNNTHARFR